MNARDIRSALFVPLLVLLSMPAVADEKAAPPVREAVGEGGFLALSVADMEKQVAWYRDRLGFSIIEQRDVPDRNIRFALLRREGLLVELLQLPDAKPRNQSDAAAASASKTHGFFKGGLVVRDIEGLRHEWQEKGVAFSLPLGEPGSAGLRMFQIKDPEGNLLQFLGR